MFSFFCKAKKSDLNLGWRYFIDHQDLYADVFAEDNKYDDRDAISPEKIVWQMWWSKAGGMQMPALIKKCMESCELYCPDGYRRILINNKNYTDYVKIPEKMLEKFHRGIISVTHLSDYIRLSLLCKYGGIWSDATCFFTDHIPMEIVESKLFYFQSPTWILHGDDVSKLVSFAYASLPASIGTIHSGSSWFIVSNRKNKLLSVVKKILERYWETEDSLIDYYLFHCAVSWAILANQECRDEYSAMPCYSNILPHLLQFSIADELVGLDEVCKLSFCHKLTWKNKKINTREKAILEKLNAFLV